MHTDKNRSPVLAPHYPLLIMVSSHFCRTDRLTLHSWRTKWQSRVAKERTGTHTDTHTQYDSWFATRCSINERKERLPQANRLPFQIWVELSWWIMAVRWSEQQKRFSLLTSLWRTWVVLSANHHYHQHRFYFFFSIAVFVLYLNGGQQLTTSLSFSLSLFRSQPLLQWKWKWPETEATS